MTEVSSQIANSSAIPAWSGFVYQGKIAFYHAIRQLVDGDTTASYLKVETLDDFVIYDCTDAIISLHQVKTMQSRYRSAYESALEQAARVNTADCSNETTRWFHVSAELDDFSSRLANGVSSEFKVQFYTYHDDRQYVETGRIDDFLIEIVTSYLERNNLSVTPPLIEHKLAKLQMMLAARVNLAHHRNQHDGMKKFKAADSIPIHFTEIEECLQSQAIDDNDHDAILFKFRDTLVDRTSNILNSHQEEQSFDLDDICKCRHTIANMGTYSLTRLYYSKKPNQKGISLAGFSTDTVDNYLRIVLKISGINVMQDLPHYYKIGCGSFLPTAMKFDMLNQRLDVKQIQENVDNLRGNLTVQDVLYDYDNLVVHMESKPFLLNDEFSATGKFTDISADDENRFTKINNVRFVSVDDASEEIND